MFFRSMKFDGGLGQVARYGDNTNTNWGISIIATDAALVLSAAQMAGGVVQFTGFTAGRVVTTDTAVAILALFPAMDIGDSFMCFVSVQTAFAATWAAGAGVTLAGKATTAASGSSWVMVTKTAAATCTFNVL